MPIGTVRPPGYPGGGDEAAQASHRAAGRRRTEDARHHHAVQVIFVGMPSAGSPVPFRKTRPGPYPKQAHQPWKPRTKPPCKAERLARFLDSIRRNDEAAPQMFKPDLAHLKVQWGRAA